MAIENYRNQKRNDATFDMIQLEVTRYFEADLDGGYTAEQMERMKCDIGHTYEKLCLNKNTPEHIKDKADKLVILVLREHALKNPFRQSEIN